MTLQKQLDYFYENLKNNIKEADQFVKGWNKKLGEKTGQNYNTPFEKLMCERWQVKARTLKLVLVSYENIIIDGLKRK